MQSLFIWGGGKQLPAAAASDAVILMRDKQNDNAALVKPEPLKEAETCVRVVSVRTRNKEKPRHHLVVGGGLYSPCVCLWRAWQKRTHEQPKPTAICRM